MSFINNDPSEVYTDVPTGGGGNRGFIGHAKAVQVWQCGWAKEETVVADKTYPKGPVYFKGTKEEAEDLAKEFGTEYVNRVVLVSMPSNSFTNLSEENKAKFQSGVISTDVRVVSMKSENYGAALNLVYLPSLVDAYARASGWYEKPLFDVQALNNIDKEADVKYVRDTLTEMRKAIWAALGEPNWELTHEKTTSAKLKEALQKTYINAWDGWVRLLQVADPSPKGYYRNEPKANDTDPSKSETSDGADGLIGRRRKIPCVVEFFSGEKAAVDAGAKELESKGGETNGAVSQADLEALFPKLSVKAKKSYDAATWQATAPVVLADLQAVGGAGATKPKLVKLAGEYELDVADVELVKALIH